MKTTIFLTLAVLVGGAWLAGLAYFFRLAAKSPPAEPVDIPPRQEKETEQWAIWGDSHSWSSAPLLDAQLRSMFRASMFNGGVSGQGVETICARLGSHAAKLKFPADTIPASGSIEVTAPNVNFYRYVEYWGTVEGVYGRLRRLGEDRPLEFTRKNGGDPVRLNGPAEFIPEQGMVERTGPVLLWMGKNDIDPNGDSEAVIEKIVRYTDEAHEWMSARNKRILVLGHFINRNVGESNPARYQVNAVNEIYAQRYGDRFIDVSGWLTSPQIWEDLGKSPSQQDLADQAAGIPPGSLAKDTAHLTAEGYAGIGKFLIFPHTVNVLRWNRFAAT